MARNGFRDGTQGSRLLTVAAADRPALVNALQRYRALSLDDLDAELRRPIKGRPTLDDLDAELRRPIKGRPTLDDLDAELRRPIKGRPTLDDLDTELARARPATGAERIAIVARLDDLGASLDAAIARLPSLTTKRWVSRAHGLSFRSAHVPGRVAFLFPGLGSEHLGMLRGLRRQVPMVQKWFDALDRAAIGLGLSSPISLIDPPDNERAREEAVRALHRMEQGAQLGSVADLAMHDVARALGLRADAYVGHSNGEHPALIAAGRVQATPDELCLGFVRLGMAAARLPLPARQERLLTVAAVPRDRLDRRLEHWQGAVHLAMDNCPNQVVVGGAADEIERFAAEVTSSNGIAALLPFERAYHTPLFQDWCDTFLAYYESLPIVPGRAPVYSCRTVAPLPDAADACRQTMVAQWTAPVQFAATVRDLHDRGINVFVEVGPDSTLTPFVEDVLRGKPHVAVSLHAAERDDTTHLQTAIGELFVAGLGVDVHALDPWLDAGDAQPIAAPVPHDVAEPILAAAVHRRLIAEARQQLSRVTALVAPAINGEIAAPLIGSIIERSASRLRAEHHLSRITHPFVDHHALGRLRAANPDGGYPLPVIAFTMSIEIAAEAARSVTRRAVRTMVDLRGSRWLALDNGRLTLDIEVRVADGVRVGLRDRTATVPSPAFEAMVTGDPAAPVSVPLDPSGGPPRQWTARTFYDRFAFHGPAFQGITRITSVGASSIAADLEARTLPGFATADMVVDPALLDCAGQLVALWLLEQQGRPPDFGVFPFRARRVSIARPPLPAGSPMRARARVSERDGMTIADVAFETPDGGFVMGIEGLEQRIVTFPDGCARRLIPGEPDAVPAAEDEEFLASSWHIWERALAHLALSAGDLAVWSADTRPTRTRWLIDRLRATGAP